MINSYNKYTQTTVEYNEKFTKIMFIFVSVMLIILKLGNLFITAELGYRIDDYVLVYNHFKGINKSSLFIILSLNKNLFFKNKLNSINKNYFTTSCITNDKDLLIFDNNDLNSTIENKVFKLTEILRINKDIVGDISFIEQDLINIFKLLLLLAHNQWKI